MYIGNGLVYSSSNIFKQLVKSRLIKYLYENEIIYEHPYGFRKHKSATLLFLDMYFTLTNSTELGQLPCYVFMHVLYTVVSKPYLPNNWFTSYLENKIQLVKIGLNISDPLCIRCGTPQDSVLGYILFLLHVVSIHYFSDKSKFFPLADDTSAHFSSTDIDFIDSLYNTKLS